MSKGVVVCVAVLLIALSLTLGERVASNEVSAQAGPEMLAPNLSVRTTISDLVTPISMAFIGNNDFLILEKNTGQVKRIVNGAVHSTVLDLGVNFASERGLLGIALHPSFPNNPGVYLFWTCRSTGAPADPFFPDEIRCLDANMFAADTDQILQVPLLGNRVDRFVWTGSTLTFDHTLIMLRAFQNDAAPVPPNQGDEAQPARGNHNGGVLRFGPDGKLYILFGDNGRRGQLQNLPCGPTANCPGPAQPDDQFGGPEPDDAHLTGVILRLNPDGTTPTDNPFFSAGASMSNAEVGANIQKIFAYGLRNSFGMDFDPKSGALWEQENGDDSFSELNRADPGFNSGWVQIMGPPDRIAQFKAIETSPESDPCLGTPYFGLQQLRWSPELLADTPAQALARLFVLPGSHYSEPEFSWKFAVDPGAIGFVRGRALGPQFEGDLFVGGARPFLEGGHLFHFNLTGNRLKIGVDDPRLEDRVADNLCKYDLTESESLLIGRNFGTVTDLQTGPNGNMFVVSIDTGSVFEIFRRK
ncbi:MAG TPA: PQQ-dependent sugar dehydrogenase [Pyrinomonadaceae bacterium]|nr:PQQ-dependent sugar dehydrogenase [Pyrinomonadaceae bacterium]